MDTLPSTTTIVGTSLMLKRSASSVCSSTSTFSSTKDSWVVGRKVVGFLSQVHVDPDLAVETFILESDGDIPATAETG